MSLVNDNVTFTCGECSFTKPQYIKIADILLENFDARCDQYSIRLSGPDRSFFIVDDFKLYIRSDVLSFNSPVKTYSVSILLINSKTSNTVTTVNHNVCIFPCECEEN